MNMFVHKSLGHFLMAEEGAGAAAGGGLMTGGDVGAPPAAAAAEPAAPPAGDVLDQINNNKTVGELEAEQAAKEAAENETPEAKAEREAAEKVAAETVPDKYADFTIPEGLDANTELLSKFGEVAKELGLTQTQAQKLVDLQASTALAETIARTQQLETALAEQSTRWVNEIKSDPELGGDKFDKNLAISQKAMQAFGGEGLRALLNESGLGNNPEVFRLFHKVGLAISEDRMVIPGSDSTESAPKEHKHAMFGDVKFN